MPRERKSELFNRISIANGRHLAAARTMAGLKQTELAGLAGLHVNSLKRLERMGAIPSGWAIQQLQKALEAQNIICQRWPTTSIREAESA